MCLNLWCTYTNMLTVEKHYIMQIKHGNAEQAVLIAQIMVSPHFLQSICIHSCRVFVQYINSSRLIIAELLIKYRNHTVADISAAIIDPACEQFME